MAGVNRWLLTVLLVGLLAAGAAVLLSRTYELSEGRIAANERARLVARLSGVLDPGVRDRDLTTVRLAVTSPELLGSDGPIDVFVEMDAGMPAAIVFATVAPHGYNAAIYLLVGVAPDGTLTGVRAVSHRETPGLGADIDIERTDWILQFDGKSLTMPPIAGWAVETDEAQFDTLTGATVTSRAVVEAVKNTLLYFEQHRDELYRAAMAAPADEP